MPDQDTRILHYAGAKWEISKSEADNLLDGFEDRVGAEITFVQTLGGGTVAIAVGHSIPLAVELPAES